MQAVPSSGADDQKSQRAEEARRNHGNAPVQKGAQVQRDGRRNNAFSRRSSLLALGACGAALIAGGAGVQGLFPPAQAIGFTATQVAAGRTAYGKSCVSCHGANLEGNQFGPALKGATFEGHWREQSPAAL